jgi:acyl-CoA thioesterase
MSGGAGRSTTRPAALYVRDGETWIPQEACVGPWSPEALHGGPVAALCVSAAEVLLPGEQLVTTRISLDLVKPVPMQPLMVEARLIKTGRRVHLVDVTIRHDGKEVALARVQRTSYAEVRLPDLSRSGLDIGPPPDRPEDMILFDQATAPDRPGNFSRLATEFRTATDLGIYKAGVKVAWLNVYADLTPGVPLSNAAAVAAASDYTNALGAPAMPSQVGLLYPNADLTLYLVRKPVSHWVRLAPTSTWHEHGIGHSRCALWDEKGMLGTSAVTLPLMEKGYN